MEYIRLPLYVFQKWLILSGYRFLLVFIVNGLFNFDYSAEDYVAYPTFSEILATRVESKLLYGIIISIYGVSKTILLIFYIPTKRPYWIPVIVFSSIHAVGFFIIGMVDVTSMRDAHVVASITFSTAVIRSCFLYMSRINTQTYTRELMILNGVYVNLAVSCETECLHDSCRLLRKLLQRPVDNVVTKLAAQMSNERLSFALARDAM
jgi:hypothetical protein